MPRLRLGDVLLALLAASTVALAALALQPPTPPTPATPTAVPSPAATPGPAPEVVFLGEDSISPAGRGSRLSAAGLAGRRLGWRTVVRAVDGTGFVRAGTAGTYATRVQRELGGAPLPDAVVLMAGSNDRTADPDELRVAATSTVQALRATVGLETRMVLVGPFGSTLPEEQQRLAVVAQVLREAAAAERVHFLDPMAEGWLADAPPGSVLADGLHLGEAGDEHLGRRLAAALERLDVRG